MIYKVSRRELLKYKKNKKMVYLESPILRKVKGEGRGHSEGDGNNKGFVDSANVTQTNNAGDTQGDNTGKTTQGASAMDEMDTESRICTLQLKEC